MQFYQTLLKLHPISYTLMIGKYTNIGRRSSQPLEPFERLEHIEPLELDLYLASF